jgi:hypothetical protein
MISLFDDSPQTHTEAPTPPDVPASIHRELFELANWMLHAAPWNKMTNRHSIAIVDPDTGETQIAAVMGNGGDIYGLHVYLPDEGTRWYCDLFFQGHTSQTQHDAQFEQSMVELAFEDGLDDVQDNHDLDLDESYAPESWNEGVGPEKLLYATFRAYRLGCAPWHPDEQEARKLLTALRLIKHYYESLFQKYTNLMFSPVLNPGKERLETRIPTYSLPEGADADDPSQWTFSIATYTSPGPKEIPATPVDDVFAGRMATHRIQPGSTWEIGAIFLPRPVLDNGRPQYSVLAIVGNRANGMVHGLTTALANECRFQLIRRCLEKAATDCGHLPANIIVGSPIAERALAGTAESCGITITPAHDPSEMSLFNEITSSLLQSGEFGNTPQPLTDMSEEEAKEMNTLFGNAPDPNGSPEEMLAFMEELRKNPKANEFFEHFLEEHPELMQEIDSSDNAPKLYTPPKSRKRHVFRVDIARAKPPIWRRITLPEDASFFDLHLAIQAAFGWSGFHLHAFEIGNRSDRIIIDWLGDDEDDYQIFFSPEKQQELRTRLKDIFSSTRKSAHYTYDFGDNWDHTVKFEKEIDDTSAGPVTPFEVIKGRGPSPLEDCGGIWGLQQIIDGTHPMCDEILPERLQEIQNGTFLPDQIYPRDPHKEMQLMDEMNQL